MNTKPKQHKFIVAIENMGSRHTTRKAILHTLLNGLPITVSRVHVHTRFMANRNTRRLNAIARAERAKVRKSGGTFPNVNSSAERAKHGKKPYSAPTRKV